MHGTATELAATRRGPSREAAVPAGAPATDGTASEVTRAVSAATAEAVRRARKSWSKSSPKMSTRRTCARSLAPTGRFSRWICPRTDSVRSRHFHPPVGLALLTLSASSSHDEPRHRLYSVHAPLSLGIRHRAHARSADRWRRHHRQHCPPASRLLPLPASRKVRPCASAVSS